MQQTQRTRRDPLDRSDLAPPGISRTLIFGTVIFAGLSKARNPNKSLCHGIPLCAKLDTPVQRKLTPFVGSSNRAARYCAHLSAIYKFVDVLNSPEQHSGTRLRIIYRNKMFSH